jgi:hypothetical protein
MRPDPPIAGPPISPGDQGEKPYASAESRLEALASEDPWMLPQALCRPDAFPPPTPTTVSLHSTHASWVFLTDQEVWKVKRPVSYGFLD